MIDYLEMLIRDNGGDVIHNNEFTEAQKDLIIKITSEVFFESLQVLYNAKGVHGIQAFLSKGAAGSSSFTDTTAALLTSTFISGAHLDQKTSQMISSVMVPLIVSKMVTLVNDRHDNTYSVDKLIAFFNDVEKKK